MPASTLLLSPHAPVSTPAASRRDLPRARRRGLPWLRMALASGLIAGLAVLASRERPEPPSDDASRITVQEPARRVPAPLWHALPGAPPGYALDLSDAPGRPATAQAARVHGQTGLREDILTVGAFDAPASPYLRVTAAAEGSAGGSLLVDLARGAAEVGLAVVRIARAPDVATKFGGAETAQIRLAANGASRACLGFRVVDPDLPLRLAGWLCDGAPADPPGPPLACALDRLVPSRPTGEAGLKTFLALLERRPVCAPRPERPARARHRR